MFYFVHIPKAGGTTLVNHFFNAFEKKSCLCVYPSSQIKDIHPKEFSSLSAQDLDGIKSILGHLVVGGFLGNGFMRKLFSEGRVTILASVRDPIDRLVSLRNYISIHKRHPQYDYVNSIEPEEYILNEVRNYQSLYLSPRGNVDLDFIRMCVAAYPIEYSERLFRRHIEIVTNQSLPEVQIENVTRLKSKGNKVLFSKKDLGSKAINTLKLYHSKDLELHDRLMTIWSK